MFGTPLTARVRLPIFSLTVLLSLAGCGDDDVVPDPPLEPTYENVERIVRQSCTFSGSCHGGTASARGRLNFQRLFDSGRPITDILFEVPSCEYAPYPRVFPGDPDRSWMWIKINNEADSRGKLLFDAGPEWDAGVRRLSDGGLATSTCPLVQRGELSFGQLMPMGTRTGISPNRRLAIYEWIRAGAPGPGGVMTMRDAGPDLGPRDLGPPGDLGPSDASTGDLGRSDMDVLDSGGADLGGADADAGAPRDAGGDGG